MLEYHFLNSLIGILYEKNQLLFKKKKYTGKIIFLIFYLVLEINNMMMMNIIINIAIVFTTIITFTIILTNTKWAVKIRTAITK